jgi:lipoprotein-anchoring transpeptidase ErfK/SrfK
MIYNNTARSPVSPGFDLRASLKRALKIMLISLALIGCAKAEESRQAPMVPQDPVHTPPAAMVNPGKPIAGLLPRGFDRDKISLLVEKSQYRLTLYYARKPIKSYPVVFGPDPVSDKRREGDGATPEGVFRIRNLYPHQSWSKFMWVNYPTQDSWRKFEAAKAAGQIPADATIGGEIGIHGVPNNENSRIERRLNWTAGCVSLTNPDIDELYSVSSKEMTVEIIP